MRYLSSRGKPLTEAPFHRFFDFIDPGADRFGILKSLLPELGLNYLVLPVAGNRHFLIFPPSAGNPLQGGRAALVLAAHYDRARGSPGANDNSAAVFLLLKTAHRLRGRNTVPWMIILTDKEELRQGQGIREQGSYSLGEALRPAGLRGAQVFIFDACGTGDTLVISTVTDTLLRNEGGLGADHTRMVIRGLRERALRAARDQGLSRVALLPTPFSDDAGFLRAGISAQIITVLPQEEASAFASVVRSRPELSGALISRERAREAETALIPQTWRRLNTGGDTHHKLSPDHFDMVIRFAEELCTG
ncbi:MAG: Zn-dependent exopeptidase M28 [Treponema sp.]|jgi:hypothetical protein|nr:Zn-dependent exopeptidase M28 [Treponema sp.]